MGYYICLFVIALIGGGAIWGGTKTKNKSARTTMTMCGAFLIIAAIALAIPTSAK